MRPGRAHCDLALAVGRSGGEVEEDAEENAEAQDKGPSRDYLGTLAWKGHMYVYERNFDITIISIETSR